MKDNFEFRERRDLVERTKKEKRQAKQEARQQNRANKRGWIDKRAA